MANPKSIAKAAAAVAFLLAAGVIAGAFISFPIVSLAFALPPLFAGIVILRGHAAGAYGYALLCLAEVLGNIVIALHNPGTRVTAIAASCAFGIGLGVLFLLAGNSLRAAHGMQGRLSPWIALAAASVIIPICFEAYIQNSASMENTLLKGDKLFVLHSPKPQVERGTLVIFRYPVDRKQTFIKRVIGVPDDHIRLKDKTVYRNGAPLTEPYAIHVTTYTDAYRDNFPAATPNVTLPASAINMLDDEVLNGELVVPPDAYFVLGDNRDDSLDSRYFGCVPAADVIGKPVLIYDSRDGAATRWNRLFKRL